jgi:hypothetical protein
MPTNVWQPHAPGVYNPGSLSAAHLNQKPLEFMRRILNAATEPGDAVWELFGGLASASVAAVQTAGSRVSPRSTTTSRRSRRSASTTRSPAGTRKPRTRTRRVRVPGLVTAQKP